MKSRPASTPRSCHYLKALEALGGNPHDGVKVVAKMKEMPTDDPLFGKGSIRADGRKLHDAYLFEVKKPAESKYPWDYYKLRRDDPRRRGVPAARRRRLPARQEINAVGAGRVRPSSVKFAKWRKRNETQIVVCARLPALFSPRLRAARASRPKRS